MYLLGYLKNSITWLKTDNEFGTNKFTAKSLEGLITDHVFMTYSFIPISSTFELASVKMKLIILNHNLFMKSSVLWSLDVLKSRTVEI